MNSTFPGANSTDALLCPFDNRRSSKELWVKLFVVHLTTIGAFCHVLSVRREPIISWKLAFFILVPYSIFAYHVLFLVAVLVAFGYLFVNTLLNKPSEETKDSLWRAPRWLFGKVPDESEVGYQMLPSTEQAPPQAHERQSRWKKVGRILLACPFLAQCIGTAVLYARRQSHHAVTFADQRVFELGCTGIITALYWLADTIELPPFSKSAPTASDATTALDKTMVMLRDCQAKPLLLTDDELPRLMSFLKNGAICFIILLIQQKLRLFQTVYAIFTNAESTPDDSFIDFFLVIIGISFGGLLSVLGCCGTPRSKTSMRLGRKRNKDDTRPWWMFFLCPVGLLVLWFPALVIFGGFIVFIFGPIDWVNIADQISVLDAWPTNTSCPLLWSDPAANWIWALA